MLVARAAALSADQQHIARHLDTDHRASACSAQAGRELLAADEVFEAIEPADVSATPVRFEPLGSNLLFGHCDARLQRSSFLLGGTRPSKQRAGLIRCERAIGQLPAAQVFLQLFWCARLGRLGLAGVQLAHEVTKPRRSGDGGRPIAVMVEDSVRHTCRSSSDKTGQAGQAASSSSASVAGVSVTVTSNRSSPSATRWAAYHPPASPKRGAAVVSASAELPSH